VTIAMHMHSIRITAGATLVAVFLPCAMVPAQARLPAPSRTIYKCHVKGSVSYSDEPRAGAQRLDVTPSRGASRLSGWSRTGKDVANEVSAEQCAVAIRPLTGMTASQLAPAGRRNALLPAARRERGQLEPGILDLEQAEARADVAALKAIQQDLLVLRKRYKTLAC